MKRGDALDHHSEKQNRDFGFPEQGPDFGSFYISSVITCARFWIILWLLCTPMLSGYVEEVCLKVKGLKMQ